MYTHEVKTPVLALSYLTECTLATVAELSIPKAPLLLDAAVLQLDEALEHYNDTLPPLREFIMPGGTPAGAQAHVARVVARRAERSVVAIHEADPLRGTLLLYLNRLSDLLFVLARVLNKLGTDGPAEIEWGSPRTRGEAPDA